MSSLSVLAFAAATAAASAELGCAALASALPDVIAYVTDGVQILDAIEIFVQAYFAKHPDEAAQAKVSQAMIKARAALNTALRVAQGAKNADDGRVDQAFDDFKAAYLSLLQLVQPYGVKPAPRAGTMMASPDQLVVPEPAVFARTVRK